MLKEKCGEDFGSLISEKVIAVAGDITIEDLGVKDVELKDQILDQVDVIVNLAATTKFDERQGTGLCIFSIIPGRPHIKEITSPPP